MISEIIRFHLHIQGGTIVSSNRVNPGWSRKCNSIPCAALHNTASTGTEAGATKNHICLDKNRSIPRNQIQRQREIPNKVVQYADHTATEAAACLFIANQLLCFPTPR